MQLLGNLVSILEAQELMTLSSGAVDGKS